jgi:hypothetical protein
MKVGDLVRIKGDPRSLCGMGIVYQIQFGTLAQRELEHVKVHWFQEHMNGGNYDEWLWVIHLEDVDESR